MKVKITYTPEHESAADATLAALRGMFPAARIHKSTNKTGVSAVYLTIVQDPGKRLNPPGDGGIIKP